MSEPKCVTVSFYRCPTCGLLVQAVAWWRDLFLRCPACKRRISDRKPVLTNPLAILETSCAGTSSYLACLHRHLMANLGRVRTTDTAFTRMTRVRFEGERLPPWSSDRWLPRGVYRPFSFERGGLAFDLIAGPSRLWWTEEDSAVEDWLTIVRKCRGLLVSVHAGHLRHPPADILQLDQSLAQDLRNVLSKPHSLRRIVLMLNAADTIAGNSEEAEEKVTHAFHTYFQTFQAVCSNERISTYATPTSTWGFGKALDPATRFPIDATPFNILEPIRCGLGISSDMRNNAGAEVGGGSDSHETPDDYDVALSYAGEDREYVEEVASSLRKRGVRVFYDRYEEASLWGEDLGDRLAQVYGTGSRYVVVFVSEHYARRAWTNHERRHAEALATQGRRNRILPARFDATEIPGLPPTIGYLDLRSLSPEMVAEHVSRKLTIKDSQLTRGSS
jgi:hypothetical protein